LHLLQVARKKDPIPKTPLAKIALSKKYEITLFLQKIFLYVDES